ncbi:MAG: EscU/YscU/HrcU family type III secretion system export apparatus switch protein [Spirochaetota bacterium]|nr:EscU/YscU/HrcU family type III secretion system export apparatus switch protein [Spirochaetota bacterium]
MKGKQKGIAIGYSGREVPKVLAVAQGRLVDRLLSLAEEYNITIYKDPDLADALALLNVGSDISENLYRAVAEVLAYCYKINEEFRDKINISMD